MNRPRPRSSSRSRAGHLPGGGGQRQMPFGGQQRGQLHAGGGDGQVRQAYGPEIGDQLGAGLAQRVQPLRRARRGHGGVADALDAGPVQRGGVRGAAVVVEDEGVQALDQQCVAGVLGEALAQLPGIDLGEVVGVEGTHLAAARAALGERAGDHAGQATLPAGDVADQEHGGRGRAGDLLAAQAARPLAAPAQLGEQPLDVVGAGQERDAVRLDEARGHARAVARGVGLAQGRRRRGGRVGGDRGGRHGRRVGCHGGRR